MTFETNTQPRAVGIVNGTPLVLLRLEGALVLFAAIYAYAEMATGWLMFAVLFLAPDVFMLGYAKNSRWGALGYNAGHSYLMPAALFASGWMFSITTLSAVALIWIGHIGFDRALGYGLKYADGFKISHLKSTL
jgi:Domain of unknown function (DUF4260)